jgi:hypothetical protein
MYKRIWKYIYDFLDEAKAKMDSDYKENLTEKNIDNFLEYIENGLNDIITKNAYVVSKIE